MFAETSPMFAETSPMFADVRRIIADVRRRFADVHRSMGEDTAETWQSRDILSLEQNILEKIYTIQSRLVELFYFI